MVLDERAVQRVVRARKVGERSDLGWGTIMCLRTYKTQSNQAHVRPHHVLGALSRTPCVTRDVIETKYVFVYNIICTYARIAAPRTLPRMNRHNRDRSIDINLVVIHLYRYCHYPLIMDRIQKKCGHTPFSYSLIHLPDHA